MNGSRKKKIGKAIGIITLDILVGLLCVGIFYAVEYVIPNKESNKTYTADATTVADESNESQSTDWGEKFASHFTDTVIQTENSYSSPNLSITLEERAVTINGSEVNYYIADIYVADITSFQTALAQDTYGTGYKDTIENMAEENNAILATNGDYYSYSKQGIVIRNGVVYRSTVTDADICVLYYDGTMKIFSGSNFDVEQAVADGAYQAWTFGPSLLAEDGGALSEFDVSRRLQSKNPRTAIGYYEPGHYCLVTVDGREEDSAGMTLADMSELFEELGCNVAYNLDGGKSSVMTYEGEVVNNPVNGGRQSSDSIIIKEVKES
ncbi:phosphodiester glycosidase family protein [Konateibacter massiliensis]|uniref:phosphodiester glycosidase family protein n=1 Tax=Konateibacter massiliensis TaxID=2002841 RepID=UPI000C146E5D|nr:phosphodiester glycosidase family protein [Konateibacter massiliensis]